MPGGQLIRCRDVSDLGRITTHWVAQMIKASTAVITTVDGSEFCQNSFGAPRPTERP